MAEGNDKEYDIYRDSLLRYAGYANEVGEAFRAQTAKHTYAGFNAPVSLTYAVAIAYCAADANDKCKKFCSISRFDNAKQIKIYKIHTICIHYF